MVRFALVGGNSNNRYHVGTFYSNLNNTVSNANWNNAAAILIITEQQLNASYSPYPLVKINSSQGTVSSMSKMVQRIRKEIYKREEMII